MTTNTTSTAAAQAAIHTHFEEIRLRLRSGDEAAIVQLEALSFQHPGWFAPLHLLMRNALKNYDQTVVFRCMELVEQQWPGGTQGYLLRALKLEHDGQSDAALDEARKALGGSANPESAVLQPLISLINRLSGPLTLRQTPIDADLVQSLSWNELLSVVQLLYSHGDVERARAFGCRVVEMRPQAKPLVDAALDGNEVAPGPAGVDWDADFISIEEPGSDTAIVAFTGLRHKTGVPLGTLYRELKPLNAHFIALRDRSRMLFMGSLPYLGGDPVVSAQLLRKHVAGLGAKKIWVIGSSAGGVGALVYGALMKVDAIIGYGAITSIDASFETREKAVRKRMGGLAPDWLGSTEDRLRALQPPIPVLLNYGQGMSLDRQHAEKIASVPGVRLKPLAGYDQHGVLNELVDRKRLLPELQAFIKSIQVGIEPPG